MEGRGRVTKENVLLQLRTIERVHGVDISNIEELASWVIEVSARPEDALAIATALNTWVAVTGRTGTVRVPRGALEEIVRRMGDRARSGG